MEFEFIVESLENKLNTKSKYLKWYIGIIGSRLNRTQLDGYTEKHHILPKSLFPEYKKLSIHRWNCVILTAREHYIVHWLLSKAFGGKLQQAFWCMQNQKGKNDSQERYTSSHGYEYAKREHSESQKKIKTGRKLTEEHKQKIRDSMKGRPLTEEHRQAIIDGRTDESRYKMGASSRGKKQSKEHLDKRVAAMQTEEWKAKVRLKKLGVPKSEEHKKKISELYTKKIICEHCGKETTGWYYYRKHGDKCEHKNELNN